MDKTELRRARRMRSNRESARRSRKRKQEHLSGLEGDIQALEEKLREVSAALESSREREAALKLECEELRSENAKLRAKSGVELPVEIAGKPPNVPAPEEGAAGAGAGEPDPPDAKKAKTGD